MTVEHALIAATFGQLPEKFRRILWYRDVEGRSAAEIAASCGLTPKGVSALTYRARKRLRHAYLQQNVTTVRPGLNTPAPRSK